MGERVLLRLQLPLPLEEVAEVMLAMGEKYPDAKFRSLETDTVVEIYIEEPEPESE